MVTGGSKRLGAAIATALAGAGYDLALHGHHDADPDRDLAGAIASGGGEWRGFVADLVDSARATALYEEVSMHFGRPVALLVNSASMFGDDRLETETASDLMDHYAVGCAAAALLTKAFAADPLAAPDARNRSIVNLLDQRLDQPHGDQLAYTLAKFALAGLTRITARTLAPAIRVNAVAPGLTIATEAYDGLAMDTLAAKMPLGALPLPEQIGEAVVYLARASSLTGQTLHVDGGARFVAFPRDFMHLDDDA